jgi:single-strand DNA-binding protein
MGESVITITGNLVRDPELRTTPNGTPVCTFTVAVTPQEKNADGWKDCETQFWNVTAWRTQGENVAESLERGDPVRVSGRVNFRAWETKEGEKRIQHEINADSVSVPLAFHAASVFRTPRAKRGEAEQAPGSTPPPFATVPRLQRVRLTTPDVPEAE